MYTNKYCKMCRVLTLVLRNCLQIAFTKIKNAAKSKALNFWLIFVKKKKRNGEYKSQKKNTKKQHQYANA